MNKHISIDEKGRYFVVENDNFSENPTIVVLSADKRLLTIKKPESFV